MKNLTRCKTCNQVIDLQTQAARARWQRKTAKQRSDAMKAVRAKGLKK